MLGNRPKLTLTPTAHDKAVELAAAIALTVLWAVALISFVLLPDQIPIHYNLAGKADRSGDKLFVFMFAGIATALYVLLTIMNRNPHLFNYPIKITLENAEEQYTAATRLLRWMKLCVIVLFVTTTVDRLLRAQGLLQLPPGTLMLGELLLIFTPVIIYFFVISKKRKRKIK